MIVDIFTKKSIQERVYMSNKIKKIVLSLMGCFIFLIVLYEAGYIQVVKEVQQVAQSLDVNDKTNTNEKRVTFNRKVDGDTAMFELDGELIKCRFLAIDTPESVKEGTEIQPYGIEASNFTESILKNANKIILEFDPESDEKDKYDRYLAWVWVDGVLLQEQLLEQGLARIEYIYGDYKYLDILEKAEQQAKSKSIGIWSQ